MKKLKVKKLQALKGGQNPSGTVSNSGCGPVFPNINGVINSGIAPVVMNMGWNRGASCPTPFITPPWGG